MKLYCEFGVDEKTGAVVARTKLVDNGKWNSVRCKRMAREWKQILDEALGNMNNGAEFVPQFRFFLEPHAVIGPKEDGYGTMWADFVRENGCDARIAAFGKEIYDTIIAATTPKEGGAE